MPRNPIADDRRELADLQRQATIIPGRDSQRIFVEPNLSAVIARVKTAIEPRLRKEINLRADLRIEKECQSRIEKSVDTAVNEARRGLFEVIDLQIERAAEARTYIIVKYRKCEGVIEVVEKVIDIEGARRGGKNAQAENA